MDGVGRHHLSEGGVRNEKNQKDREKRKEDWGLRIALNSDFLPRIAALLLRSSSLRFISVVEQRTMRSLLLTLFVVFVVVATRLTEVDSLPSLLLSRHHRHHHVLPRSKTTTCTSSSSKSKITRCYLSKDLKENEQAINDYNTNNNFKGIRNPNERYENNFGPLLPIAEAVDTFTNGWGLSYADLRPVTPRTPVGIAFLLTNILYNAAGIYLLSHGDIFYGTLMELAGIVSFVYHYTQLELGKDRSEVRLALLIDYFFAGSALLTGTYYMIIVGFGAIPMEALTSAVGAVICLSLCWVWEYGYPYILWHSLWHILSAYTGYLVGLVHLSTNM